MAAFFILTTSDIKAIFNTPPHPFCFYFRIFG